VRDWYEQLHPVTPVIRARWIEVTAGDRVRSHLEEAGVTETWAATTFGAMQAVMERTYREMYSPRRAAAPLPAMGSMDIVPVNEAGDDDAFIVTLGDGGQYLVEFRLTGPDEELDDGSDLGYLLQFATNVNEQQEEIPKVIEVVLA
jgi:hypothetical protein